MTNHTAPLRLEAYYKGSIHKVRAVIWARHRIHQVSLDNQNDWIDVSDVELRQSTGLFDKNGKEIFGGDIVRGFTYSNGYMTIKPEGEGPDPYVGVVKYGAWDCAHCHPVYGFTVKCEQSESAIGTSVPGLDAKDIEVIGNVFENPELVEGEA